MTDIAIRAEKLGKRYFIGANRERYRTLRDSLTRALSAPWRRMTSVLRGGRAESAEEELWALKDISFEVKHGEAVGIIGNNGAGKSTLLKVLSRITDPTEGRAELTGRVGSLLEVGTGFHPELTGRENIFLNGAVLGMKRAEIARKFDEIVAFSEVERMLDTPVKHYSTGMYMRLAFAIAAHLEPEILVVDEVLAVGDAEFQKKCLGKMGEVMKRGRTILFVSHNLGAVENLCGRVIHLHKGRLLSNSKDVRAVINEYLFSGARGASLAEWKSTENELKNQWLAPVSFRAVNSSGQTIGDSVRGDSDTFIEIAINIEKMDPGLSLGYIVYDEEGHLLFYSMFTDGREEQWPRLKPGICTLRSRLPKHLLNAGTYRLEMVGGLYCRGWFFEPGKTAPEIFLTIQGGLSESPMWTLRRPGSIAPLIEWTSDV